MLLGVVPSGGALLVLMVPAPGPGLMCGLSTPRLLKLGEVFGSGSVDDWLANPWLANPWLANPIGPAAFTGGTVALQ